MTEYAWALLFEAESAKRTITKIIEYLEEDEGSDYNGYCEMMEEEGEEAESAFTWLMQTGVLEMGYEVELDDLSPLSVLTTLSNLEIVVSPGVDLSPIAQLKSLGKLGLHTKGPVDLSVLSHLAMLSEVHISASEITNRSSFEGTALKKLTLSGLGGSLEGFGDLSGLKHLDIRENGLESLAPVRSMPELELLFAQNNRVSDLAPLAKANKLSRLELSGNCITEWSIVEQLPRQTESDLERLRSSAQLDSTLPETQALLTDWNNPERWKAVAVALRAKGNPLGEEIMQRLGGRDASLPPHWAKF